MNNTDLCIVEERDLFRKYEISFNNNNVGEMILTKKAWKRKYPNKNFYRSYGKYLIDNHEYLITKPILETYWWPQGKFEGMVIM